MRIGVSNSVAGSPVVKRPSGVGGTPPVITNAVATCLAVNGDKQSAEAWTDVPCLFQFRTKIGKGAWTAWGDWSSTPSTWREQLYFDTSVGKSSWYCEVNAKDENGVMASNNSQGAEFAWGLSGDCVIMGK